MNWKEELIKKLKQSSHITEQTAVKYEKNEQLNSLKKYYESLKQTLQSDIREITEAASLHLTVHEEAEELKIKWSFLDRYLLLRVDTYGNKVILSVNTDKMFDQVEIYQENGRFLSFYNDKVTDVHIEEISKHFVTLFFD